MDGYNESPASALLLDRCRIQALETLAGSPSGRSFPRSAFSHAVLIEGEPGCGRYPFALYIAALLLCEGADSPCGRCPSCAKISAGSHPDVITVGSGAESGISVDAIRAVKTDSAVLPNEAPQKIYILRDAQRMTVQAQNALLKLLEEPPVHVRFILTADNRMALLQTVQSRVVSVRLEPYSVADCAAVLRRNLPDAELELCAHLAEISQGNVGTALSCAKDPAFLELFSLCGQVVSAANTTSDWEITRLLAPFENDREQFLRFLTLMKRHCSGCIAALYPGDAEISALPASAEHSALQFVRIADIIDKARGELAVNGYLPLIVSLFGARIRSVFRPDGTLK